MNICDSCIHEKACKAQYRCVTGAGTDESFGYPEFQCAMYEDKSYYLRPKYRIGDHVWTVAFDEKDNLTGIEEFAICEIQWDGDEFEYYDPEYFLHQEHDLFTTKEEAEVFLKEYLEVL